MRLPPGVVAYEAYAGNGGWGEIGVAERLKWAAVEAAVLADAQARIAVLEATLPDVAARAARLAFSAVYPFGTIGMSLIIAQEVGDAVRAALKGGAE